MVAVGVSPSPAQHPAIARGFSEIVMLLRDVYSDHYDVLAFVCILMTPKIFLVSLIYFVTRYTERLY